jgi:peptidoglycan/LPS O-acetylase OafA/YrhL
MAFHYTSKFDEMFHFTSDAPFYVPWGYLGVNLFFVISGFVIFMTLERTRVPLDFIVSRASRLFPAYWAAILLTFSITHVLGLPGKEVSWSAAVMNLPMVQLLFSVPLVDSVYWTLLVELLFYGLAFSLFLTRSMHRVLLALGALFCLRLVYWGLAEFAHVDLPWRVRQLLILDYIPWFSLGIVAFRLVKDPAAHRNANLFTAALAILVLGLTESILIAMIGIACFLAVWGAAGERLSFLRFPVLVWLGTISYPLYLLHENIGWAILRQLQFHGWTPLPAIAATTVLAIALAAAVSYSIERPAMAWIRGRYKQSRSYLSSRAVS